MTASRLGDVLAPKTTKRNRSYLADVASERIGFWEKKQDNPPWFWHGRKYEPIARRCYTFTTMREVTLCGLIVNKGMACSPDGLVGNDGGIEIKSMKSVKSFRKAQDGVPPQYMAQIMGCLYVTERDWWDFVGYRTTTGDIVIHRVLPDPDYFERIRVAIEQFEKEISEVTNGKY